jgi:hypothetical protein
MPPRPKPEGKPGIACHDQGEAPLPANSGDIRRHPSIDTPSTP